MTDPFVGQLTFFRVYSGVLNSGDTVYNPIKGKKERIGRLLQMHANQREEIKEVRAGDIAAAVGLQGGHDRRHAVRSGQADHPRAHGIPGAGDLAGRRAQDQGRPGEDGHRAEPLAQEDPSFRVHTDEETGQTIISGMGELHLEIIVDRMKREFGVEANVGKPQVAYRETIRKSVDPSRASSSSSPAVAASTATSCSRSSRTRARASSSSTPSRAARCRASTFPRSRRACARRCPTGVLAGYPVVDVKVTLFDGSYHEVDSNENAFKMAASMGFKEGMRRANPVLLEPMMAVEVETPEDYIGNVIGDLMSRRGQMQGQEDVAGTIVIKAEVPLSEMFGYSTSLRSATQGRATYTMEFKHYAEAPKNVAESIINQKAAAD